MSNKETIKLELIKDINSFGKITYFINSNGLAIDLYYTYDEALMCYNKLKASIVEPSREILLCETFKINH